MLVVGGGPAGLAAALAAADAGADVILADEQDALGGHTRWELGGAGPMEQTIARLERHPRIELFTRAVAFGAYEGGLVPLRQGTRMIGVRCQELIVATGRHEYPLVFADNDRPGVMLSSAVRRLLRQGVRPGERAVVVTTCSEGYALAAELSKRGVQVAAVVDSRPADEGSAGLADLLLERQVRLLPGHGIVRALGRRRVTGAVVAPLDGESRAQPALGVELGCDFIVVAGVSTPEVALLRDLYRARAA